MGTVTSYESAANMRIVVGLAAGDTSKDAILQSILDEVTNEIDLRCNRRFTPTTAVRTIEVPACAEMYIEDAITVSSVVQDGVTLVANTDYELRPYALTRLAPSYMSIVRMTAARPNGRPKAWAGRGQFSTVVITANWGFQDPDTSALPYPIVQACQQWTARVYQARIGHYENERGEAAGGLALVQDPRAFYDKNLDNLLQPFKRRTPNFSLPAWRTQ